MKVLITEDDILDLFKIRTNGERSIGLHRDWFPIQTSPILSGIIGDLMSDGHLQGPRLWRIDFTSKHKHELNRFENSIFDLFHIKGKIRPCNGNKFGKTFNIGINNKLLSRILFLSGVPIGSKVKTEFLIPNWILNDRECFRTFVKRVFTCEGCVDTSRDNPFIVISMWKSEKLLRNGLQFFNQIKDNLDKFFKIRTTKVFLSGTNIRKDGIITRGLRIHIKRLDSLINFNKEIGFEDKEKQDKLIKIIKIKSTGQ